MSVLSEAKILELAHRRATKYTHRTTPGETAYGFTAQHLIDFVRNDIEAAVLEAQGKQEPVAWCVAYDDPRMGRIHSNPSMCEPEVDTHVSKCGGVVVKVPLYAAPVVQPDMVLEGFKAACAFIDNHAADPDITSEMRKTYAEFMRMRTMIAAAEGKSNA